MQWSAQLTSSSLPGGLLLAELQIVDLLLCTGTFSSNTTPLFAVSHAPRGHRVQKNPKKTPGLIL